MELQDDHWFILSHPSRESFQGPTAEEKKYPLRLCFPFSFNVSFLSLSASQLMFTLRTRSLALNLQGY